MTIEQIREEIKSTKDRLLGLRIQEEILERNIHGFQKGDPVIVDDVEYRNCVFRMDWAGTVRFYGYKVKKNGDLYQNEQEIYGYRSRCKLVKIGESSYE